MAITRDHELHRRRLTRNIGLGGALVAFCAIVFGLTVVKIKGGAMMQAYDHQPRVSLTPPVDTGVARPAPAQTEAAEPGTAPQEARP